MAGLLSIFGFLGCRLFIGLAFLVGALWLFISIASAAPQTQEAVAPEISLPTDWTAFRNVVETGDLFVLGRYNLPEGTAAWDSVDQVLMRLIWQSPPAEQERTPPALGHALGAFYLEAGHACQWGSADCFVRFQGNPSLYEDVNIQDRAINFGAAGADSVTLVTASSTRQSAMCDVFKDELQALEQADPELSAGELTIDSAITQLGTTISVNAFPGAASVLPECFAVGTEQSGQAFDPTDPALRDDLVTEVEGTSWWTSWTALVAHWGMAGNEALIASVFVVMGSFGLLIVLSMVTQSVVYGTVAGVVGMLGGALWVPHTLLQVVMVLIAVSTVLAMGFWWQRIPR